MPLVDWLFLDRRYNDAIDSLLSEKSEKHEQQKAKDTLLEQFEAFSMSRARSETQDLKQLIEALSAPGIRGILQFSTEIFHRWQDIRQEFNELKASNAKLIAERHRYKQNIWQSPSIGQSEAAQLKIDAPVDSQAIATQEALSNLTRNVNAYRLALAQYGFAHPETEAAFESMEHANTEASHLVSELG